MTYWLRDAAMRAGFTDASTLLLPEGCTPLEAWERTAKALNTTPMNLAQRVAPTLGLHPANMTTASVSAARLVPEKLARRYQVLPLRDTDRQLVAATSEPGHIEAEQALAFASGRRVTFELAPPHVIAHGINRAYTADANADSILDGLDASLSHVVQVLHDERPESLAPIDAEAAPVVRLTNLILRDAVIQRASDIHIEPGDDAGVVRFRVDGVMRQYMSVRMPLLNRVISRIKVLSRLDIADRVRPQDGRSRLDVAGCIVDLRVSTVPVRHSEKVVMRVLRPDSNTSLSEIGIAAPEMERLRSLLSYRDGIVLVTGPTGSGKTTTMYAALQEIAGAGDVNIMTVEDPVEYQLPRISQIQADTKRGVTFASALRAILRQDPDVIFVGEIRDLETGEIAVQAAMTGHLVLATLHTNDAVSAVSRLLDLGLDRAALAGTIRGCVAQRLVRRTCQDCPGSGECARCLQTGFYGRLPINEVAVFTPEIAELIARGATLGALQQAAIGAGMRPLRTVASELLAASLTTSTEVERVLGGVPAVGAAAAKPASVPTTAEPVVFVVDDDPVQRLLVSSTLERSGYRVAQASDGAEAWRRIEAGEECSLLLTDLHMPELDGDALIRRLRAAARTAVMPIVVLTGSAETDRETDLIDAGADDYIRKPVDPPRLLARVRAALRRAA